MREHEEDTAQKLKSYDKGVQAAWNMMSTHNSELLLENYELKEQLDRVWSMSVFKFIVWKVKGWIDARNIYERE